VSVLEVIDADIDIVKKELIDIEIEKRYMKKQIKMYKDIIADQMRTIAELREEICQRRT